MRNPQAVRLAAALLAALPLAGCMGGGSAGLFDPTADVAPTGRTISLKMDVVDLFETGLYPGLKANLWAFCVEPLDPNDAVSRAAITYYAPLPTDAPLLSEEKRATCSVPGPTIRVRQGDRVVVEFGHSHVHPHTVHWHGQFVDNEDDGVPGLTQQGVPTGGSITYDFIAKRPGTLWYHCHVDTQLHVMQGLYGVFIVEPQDTSREPEADSEAVLVLASAARNAVEAIPGVNPHQHPPGCFTSGTPDCQNPPMDVEPDVFLLNGHSHPYTELQPESRYHVNTGESLRIRMLNAGTTVEALHLHGHDMLVTHKDGLPLSAPYWADTLTIAPAERYDVVVEGHNPGVWAFHTHVNSHETNDQQSPGGMHTVLTDGHDHEGDTHAFPSELPGGVAYQKPVYMPQDYRDEQQLSLGAAPAAPAVPGAPALPLPSTGLARLPVLTFPVDLPCGLDAVEVEAFLSGPGAGVSDLALAITDPNGNPFGAELHLGRSEDAQDPDLHARYNNSAPGTEGGVQGIPKGNYTVSVSGSAAQSVLFVTVSLDYHSSFDEIKYLHRLDKRYALCGRYGNGTDGLETQAPPP